MPESVPPLARPSEKPKYQQLFEALSADIHSGRFKPGEKLPSEAALVKKFATSRITVGRALRELQHLGMVTRVAGSGTFVRETPAVSERSLLFGLLIPDLGETEIFEPICRGIANAPAAGDHALLWGHSNGKYEAKPEQARELCRQYLARQVSGVFFAPLEFERDAEKTNRAILAAFRNAHIPVVLLDHRPAVAAEAKRHDLVGLNNQQAGFVATDHLVRLGCKRIGFLSYHGSQSTIIGRAEGYAAALREHGLPVPELAFDLEARRDAELSPSEEMDGWVCVNDRVAGQLMHALLAARVRIPEEVRIIGIDDAGYATLLPVALTTVRQPCREIGEAALAMMLERIQRPKMPARDLLFDGELIVRASCGAAQTAS